MRGCRQQRVQAGALGEDRNKVPSLIDDRGAGDLVLEQSSDAFDDGQIGRQSDEPPDHNVRRVSGHTLLREWEGI